MVGASYVICRSQCKMEMHVLCQRNVFMWEWGKVNFPSLQGLLSPPPRGSQLPS